MEGDGGIRQELPDPTYPGLICRSKVKGDTWGDQRSRDIQGKKGAQDRAGRDGVRKMRRRGTLRNSPRQTAAGVRENEGKMAFVPCIQYP